MNKEKLGWEEMVATEPELVGINSDIIKKIVQRAIEEERERIKQEVINWIKKIRLAGEWRTYQLRYSDSVIFKSKPSKPKEPMGQEEIDYYIKFGSLRSDTCKLIKVIFNISDEDLK